MLPGKELKCKKYPFPGSILPIFIKIPSYIHLERDKKCQRIKLI